MCGGDRWVAIYYTSRSNTIKRILEYLCRDEARYVENTVPVPVPVSNLE